MNAIKQRRSRLGKAPYMGSNLSNQPIREPITGQVQATVYSHRLSREQYVVLEQRALLGVSVREDTTAIQAGYLAGIEHVLRLIRDGFSVA
jgi:hypothetical protein